MFKRAASVLCGALTVSAVLTLGASTAAAQNQVLLLAQDNTSVMAGALRSAPEMEDWEITEMSGQLGNASLGMLEQYPVVVVWSNSGLSDAQAAVAGNALSDYVDMGGCVVEMVFTQYSTGFDIEGRWRTENYSNVGATGANIYSGGTLGTVAQPAHPLMLDVDTVGTSNFRTGDAPLLPGAQLVASYSDGQVLAAVREDKAGAVVWLGMYPGQANLFQGDWQQLFANSLNWCSGNISGAHAGGPYVIDEGAESVTLDASQSRGEILGYAWDLNNDGNFDDAFGPEVVFDTTTLDGPSETRVAVQVTLAGNELAEDEAMIVVNNVAPVIASTPPDLASVNIPYSYLVEVDDPAGAELDPPTFQILEGPQEAVFTPEGELQWTPGPDDFEVERSFLIQVDDGDGGVVEQAWTLFITAPDADGDRIPDEQDNCVDVPNPVQGDADGDEIGDSCDPDDDNDDVRDEIDNCQLRPNEDQADNDNDGAGDVCDDDDDNDFVPDIDDNCPTVTNPSQSDSDDNGVGDACDDDLDLDGVKDDDDNCPEDPNADQADLDEDGVGDVCDDDRDGDGLSDEREADLMTDPLDPDTDGDGLSDGEEADTLMSDPTERDSDGDGIADGREVDQMTDPNDADSDDDGLDDGDEDDLGTDPNDVDSDDDGLNDGDEIERRLDPTNPDTDGGGVNDGDEVTNGTNPADFFDDQGDQGDPDNTDGGDQGDDESEADGGEVTASGGCHQAPGAPPTPWAALLLMGLILAWRRRSSLSRPARVPER